MRIARLSIANFRSIKALDLDRNDTTVLIELLRRRGEPSKKAPGQAIIVY